MDRLFWAFERAVRVDNEAIRASRRMLFPRVRPCRAFLQSAIERAARPVVLVRGARRNTHGAVVARGLRESHPRRRDASSGTQRRSVSARPRGRESLRPLVLTPRLEVEYLFAVPAPSRGLRCYPGHSARCAGVEARAQKPIPRHGLFDTLRNSCAVPRHTRMVPQALAATEPVCE